ncbi:hypothetical protein [Pseudomonas fluorescens]|uniref:Uncharacterized protein n=1 Tax=Pseudomonas fluorescens TaxID=294 RepID=A0A0D0MYV1_PSEFL|nr:hypothetical protein [Pseudomonas fluorescens]KIQ60955.1 hypothetical protein RL74_02645 [Pseudomonas fluorescens]
MSNDTFRFEAHQSLLELDAATTKMMMLVVAGEVSGCLWKEAFSRVGSAYTALASVVAGVQIDAMPALDGRSSDDLITPEK